MPDKMKPPERGNPPKRITTKNPPGGPMTPGAKAKREADNSFKKCGGNYKDCGNGRGPSQ